MLKHCHNAQLLSQMTRYGVGILFRLSMLSIAANLLRNSCLTLDTKSGHLILGAAVSTLDFLYIDSSPWNPRGYQYRYTRNSTDKEVCVFDAARVGSENAW